MIKFYIFIIKILQIFSRIILPASFILFFVSVEIIASNIAIEQENLPAVNINNIDNDQLISGFQDNYLFNEDIINQGDIANLTPARRKHPTNNPSKIIKYINNDVVDVNSSKMSKKYNFIKKDQKNPIINPVNNDAKQDSAKNTIRKLSNTKQNQHPPSNYNVDNQNNTQNIVDINSSKPLKKYNFIKKDQKDPIVNAVNSDSKQDSAKNLSKITANNSDNKEKKIIKNNNYKLANNKIEKKPKADIVNYQNETKNNVATIDKALENKATEDKIITKLEQSSEVVKNISSDDAKKQIQMPFDNDYFNGKITYQSEDSFNKSQILNSQEFYRNNIDLKNDESPILSNSIDYKNIGCNVDKNAKKEILQNIIKNKTNINNLPNCLKLDRELMFQVAIADYQKLSIFPTDLKKDRIFIYRIIKIHPKAIEFIDDSLLADDNFMTKASYIYRDALRYCHPKLADNLQFMEKMINRDSRNYIYASSRIRSEYRIALLAIKDNPLLLEFAPDSIRDNINIAKIAINIDDRALNLIGDNLKNDQEIIALNLNNRDISQKLDNAAMINNFLEKNYLAQDENRYIYSKISNQGLFFANKQLIKRDFIVKWQRNIKDSNENDIRLNLKAVDDRNSKENWQNDFKKYPDLARKVKDFFVNRNIDSLTIDNLKTTYLWNFKIDNNFIVAFNLYLFRSSKERDSNQGFANITSLTAIAKFDGNKWNLSVIEAIFDSDIKLDIGYFGGHKKYILWDLYRFDGNDNNLKVIFKVEDKLKEYFEIYALPIGAKKDDSQNKFNLMHRYHPILN